MPARKPKASELQYFGQAGSADEPNTNTVVAAHEGRIVGHLSSEMMPGVGRKLRVAWVDPDLQKRGIGSTMYHLERSRFG